ncbi:hypothetical protein ACJ4V0_16050 [Phreatobacter sp. HK31-P]
MIRPNQIQFRVDPRHIPMEKAARRLFLTPRMFKEKRQELERRGFPRPDATTGNYDLKAIDAWMDQESQLQSPEAAAPLTLGERYRQEVGKRKTKAA